jgi:hypothetical protein
MNGLTETREKRMGSQNLIDRRAMLEMTGCGFGALALAGLTSKSAIATPFAAGAPHHMPRAKRAIFLFMQGGPSHVDSFDYKPMLYKKDGEKLQFDDARVLAKTGKKGSSHRVMKPLWEFKQHGETGRWVSALFPHMARYADDLTMVHSLHTEGVAHGPATLFLHCGATSFIRPSIGSWLFYGLGSENDNLPGFVSIGPSAGNGGPRNFGSAFLPPVFQGTAVGKAGDPTIEIRNLTNSNATPAEQKRLLKFLQEMNRQQYGSKPADAELDAVIESYELAWRMQMNAPDILDINRESKQTLSAYGVDQKTTSDFGRKCLLARRLVESGVRYVQVTYGDSSANPAWDQHSNMPKHAVHAKAVDQPIGALLADLKQRGLLEDTLVWWGGEFGRTPYAQDNGTGRDHNPNGFTMWFAGGGTKPGVSHGATDEFGHAAIENKVHMHDLHATILHLLGLDHLKLTYRYAGRDFRLTDVHGRVVKEILA